MAPPNTTKIIAGTAAAAITLTAGVAIAADGGAAPEEPRLTDVVLIRDVSPPVWSASDIVTPTDEPEASPFDTIDSPESPESPESPDSPESPESPDSPDTVDSP